MHSLKETIGNLMRIYARLCCRSICSLLLFTIGLLLSECNVLCTAALETANRTNASLIAVIGDTVNVSCFTTSVYPVDFYHQPQDGASPILIYANGISLDYRYDVVGLSGECREVNGKECHQDGGPGYDRGVCCYVLILANVQHNDTGLYVCTEHGEPPSNPLGTVHLTITDGAPNESSSTVNDDSKKADLPSPTTTGFAISWLLLAIIVTGLIICYLVRRRNLVHRPFRSAVQCSDSQQGVPFVA